MKYWMLITSVILIGALATPARASECDQLTYLRFSAPVELPGIALPAGTYRFLHPDCQGGVLRVTSQNGLHVFGTFLTIPDYRVKASNAPEVVLAEMPAGIPEAVKAWFYPGRRTGDALVYSKRDERRIAAAPEHIEFAD